MRCLISVAVSVVQDISWFSIWEKQVIEQDWAGTYCISQCRRGGGDMDAGSRGCLEAVEDSISVSRSQECEMGGLGTASSSGLKEIGDETESSIQSQASENFPSGWRISHARVLFRQGWRGE